MEQKKMKMALPSKDEQLSLHNTDIILKTNLTRLQLNEIVSSVRDDEGNAHRKKLTVWLEQVTDVLKRWDRGTYASMVGSSRWLEERGLKGFVLRSSACTFSFKPPVSVQLIGSYALGTATAPILNCDVAIVMSSSCFDVKDILNHVYFDKKTLFLAAVADILRNEGICSTIQVSMLQGDSRKPYLMIEPNFKCRYVVRIFPCVPATAFKLTQLKPTKNNIRSSSWMSVLKTRRQSSAFDKPGDLDPFSLPATPFYNMAILEDIAMVPQFKILTRACETCPCFKDVCIILKVWMAKKNMRFGVSDIGGHCMQMIVAYLYQVRQIGSQTTVLGALQVVMGFISGTSFDTVTLDFGGESREIREKTERAWPAALFHPVGKDADAVKFNCLWRASVPAMHAIKIEAAIALALLQTGSDTSFHRLFLEDAHFLARYDSVFTMTLDLKGDEGFCDGVQHIVRSDRVEVSPETSLEDEEVACLDMTVPQYICAKVYSTIKTALTDRVVAISATIQERRMESGDRTESSLPGMFSWDICTVPPSDLQLWVVRLGLIINEDHARRQVDKGPSAVAIDSATGSVSATTVGFRTFWGPKCELRRFKDGSIVDAVVWDADDASAACSQTALGPVVPRNIELTGELIVETIVRYALGRFLPQFAGCSGGALLSLGTLDRFLPENSEASIAYSSCPTPMSVKQMFLSAIDALDRLRGILTSELKELPLVFESVSGVVAELRYTSTLPPIPQPLFLKSKELLKPFLTGLPLSLSTHPFVVVGTVEGGGKWPSDSVAARKIKTALFVRTSALLRNQFEIPSLPFEDHLDIFMEGYMFRLVIVFSSEIPTSRIARSLSSLSRHHQRIRTLNAAYSSYSATVRLMHIWFSKSCFSGLVSQRGVELLVASIFTESTCAVLYPARTSISAIFRALYRLGWHDFEVSPLMVNIDDQGFAPINADKIVNALKDAVPATSSKVLFVFSVPDLFENDTPLALADCMIEKASLHLLQQRARNAAEQLSCAVRLTDAAAAHTVIRELFEGQSLLIGEQCNLILKFNSSLATKADTFRKGPQYANVKMYVNAPIYWNPDKAVVNESCTNSANGTQEAVVRSLRERFSRIALFLWDDTVGDRIFVILKPAMFIKSMQFAPIVGRRKRPGINTQQQPKGDAVLDVSQLVADMLLVGNGCFSDVEFR